MNLSADTILNILNLHPQLNSKIYICSLAVTLFVDLIFVYIAKKSSTNKIKIVIILSFFIFNIVYIHSLVQIQNCKNNANAYISIAAPTDNVQVQNIPNHSLSTGYKKFFVDNKPYIIYCDTNSKYIKDSKNYIKVAHVKLTVKNKWLLYPESTNVINNSKLNYAEEIHY